jgi:hypothetical protein
MAQLKTCTFMVPGGKSAAVPVRLVKTKVTVLGALTYADICQIPDFTLENP